MAALSAKVARTSNRGSKPGERRGGRVKGTPNKLTAALKDMILEALHNKGGVEYLELQADENPNAFLTLVGKVLPLQVTGANGGPVQIQKIELVAPKDNKTTVYLGSPE